MATSLTNPGGRLLVIDDRATEEENWACRLASLTSVPTVVIKISTLRLQDSPVASKMLKKDNEVSPGAALKEANWELQSVCRLAGLATSMPGGNWSLTEKT